MHLNKILALSLFTVLLSPAVSAAPSNGAEQKNNGTNSFLNSEFVRTSVWPGVGPFQQDTDNKLVDPTGNRLIYSLTGDQINTCQLEIRGGTSEAQSILNLQMSTDFLLESFGIKPAQIHAVNEEIKKNSKLLTGNNYNPVQADIAPFSVSLQNLGVNEGTDSPVYRVIVKNEKIASGSSETDKAEGKQTEAANAEENAPDNNMTTVKSEENIAEKNDEQITDSSNPVNPQHEEQKSSDLKKQSQEQKEESVTMFDTATRNPANQASAGMEEDHKVISNRNNDEVKSAKHVPAKPLTKEEAQKKNFCTIIENWQAVKKVAVKDRDTKMLGDVLAGKALLRQSDAIKWLADNHKYYDMTPGGANVEDVVALPGKDRYAVFAEVKENTKYIDEESGQVLQASDDTYKVNYTIEKVGQKWLITDSALVKNAADKAKQKASLQKASPKAGSKRASSTTRTH